MFAALVTKLLEFVLQVLCFHRPLPTPAQITLKALKTRRRNLVSQGDAMVDIPPELSFDRVVYPQPGEETPPPVSRTDFLHYLTNVARTPEQFQFVLFVLLYTQLYTILASQGAAGLSPPWTAIDEKNVRSAVFAARRESHTTSIISTTPPATANSDYTEFGIYTGSSSIESTYTPPSTAGADDSPTATNSQLSNEIEKCLATYIRCNSPRQLNLSDLNYALLVQALKQSNHPDVFRLAVKQVEHDLRVSHREFINFVLRAPALPSHSSHSFASRLIGAALIALSLATAVIMTVSNIRREFRAVVVPFFFAGVVTSFCAERQVFVWCSEEVEELLEGGGVEGKGKRKVQGVVVMQGVWAGGLAAVCFCALFLLVPQGNKF